MKKVKLRYIPIFLSFFLACSLPVFSEEETSIIQAEETVAKETKSDEVAKPNKKAKSNEAQSNKKAKPNEAKSNETQSNEALSENTENLSTRQILMQKIDTNNNELKNLREECAQAILDVKNAKAGMGPTIDLTVSATYMTNPMIDPIVLNVDEMLNSIDWPDGISAPSSGQFITLYDGMEKTYYNFQLEITQPIFTWGKITNAIKLYEEVAFVKQMQMASKRKQMGTELDTRMVSLYYLEQIQNMLLSQNEYASRLVQICEDAERNGLVLHQDTLEAKINAQQIDISAKGVQEQYSNVLLGIQKLTGDTKLTFKDVNVEPNEESYMDFAKKDRAELRKKAISQEQDSFTMLRSLEKISGYAKQIANASVYWKPDFALQATIGYAGSRFPFAEADWYRQDDYTANFTIAFKTTVWDGGKKLNEIKRSESQQNVAAINYNDAERSILQTLTEQFNAMDLALTKIEYQKLKMETLDSKIQQQEKLFSSGVGSEQDLLQAKIDRTTAEIELLQQKLSLAAAVNTIKFLTGER